MTARGPALSVEGAAKLRRTLKAADAALLERLKAAHRAAAETVAARARQLAPVASGRLKRTVRPGATRTGALVRAGTARVRYAQPIHWGWPKRHITARPFLSDAARQTEPAWLEQYHREVLAVLDTIEGASSP